ncbi:MAG: hypothetical protein Q7J30_01265, partial [Candidatus Azambacteria bacterium]|nr:hypothetical protein [Candidatus Azambacteria bacterium]
MKIIWKIFLAVVVGALIIGGSVYFFDKSTKKENAQKPVKEGIVDSGGNDSSVSQNCGNIPGLPDNALKLATKIIDGDTFLIEGGYSIRVLGIDADERGYPCYN